MKRLIGLCLLLLSINASALEVSAGDDLSIPIRKGSYVMLLWGNTPLWYDSKTEWFSDQPIRNYSSITMLIPRSAPVGDYQFVEIISDGNPKDLNTWKWVQKTDVRVCDKFTVCGGH